MSGEWASAFQETREQIEKPTPDPHVIALAARDFFGAFQTVRGDHPDRASPYPEITTN